MQRRYKIYNIFELVARRLRSRTRYETCFVQELIRDMIVVVNDKRVVVSRCEYCFGTGRICCKIRAVPERNYNMMLKSCKYWNSRFYVSVKQMLKIVLEVAASINDRWASNFSQCFCHLPNVQSTAWDVTMAECKIPCQIHNLERKCFRIKMITVAEITQYHPDSRFSTHRNVGILADERETFDLQFCPEDRNLFIAQPCICRRRTAGSRGQKSSANAVRFGWSYYRIAQITCVQILSLGFIDTSFSEVCSCHFTIEKMQPETPGTWCAKSF